MGIAVIDDANGYVWELQMIYYTSDKTACTTC